MRDSSHLKVYQLFLVLHGAGLIALRLAYEGEHVKAMLDLLAIQSGASFSGWFLSQLLTHVFVHVNPVEFIASTTLLLFFGASVERALGAARFTVLYLGAAAATAVAFEALTPARPPIAYVGGLGAGAAMLVAHVLLEPRKRTFGVLPAPVLFLVGATLVLATTIYLDQEPIRTLEENLGRSSATFIEDQWKACCREAAALPHLLGFTAGALLFTLDLGACWAARRHRVRSEIRFLEEELHARERVEALLEKISRQGVGALSRGEKKFLKNASARFYFDRKRVPSE